MTVRLRPHHLLCLLTYKGEGYSPAFCANFEAIVERVARSEEIEICAGPDDICAPWAGTPAAHCRNESVARRDAQAADAIGNLTRTRIARGARLRLDASTVDRMRHAFAAGTIRAACTGCEWHALCTQIAGRDYAETRLRRQPAT